ncbi:hypothetical protein M407DRAFT_20363 [Tulasnella calospora MUT 4182]|uniref:Uncharacterized protein n=1 Tax=Tulasnella calospora MUT 4182 TaxID=1051891 RepID=A0A0C3L9Q8_9AGAM|nr:hypothetical protein M407DRAFT_20363 [Tulasnella calospora MUT 4182]
MVLSPKRKRRCTCGKEFEEVGYARHVRKCDSSKTAARRAVENHQNAIRKRKERQAEALVEEERKRIISETQTIVQEEISAAPQPETFHDVLPVRIPGLQSALSGVILPSACSGDQLAEPNIESEDLLDSRTGRRQRPQRSTGARRLPARFRELLPEGPATIVPTPQPSTESSVSNTAPSAPMPAPNTTNGDVDMESQALSSSEELQEVYRTLPNAFNIFREYKRLPLRIPDEGAPLEDFTIDYGSLDAESLADKLTEAIKPFSNMSTYRLGHWYHNCGGVLSRNNLAALITEVLKAEDFNKDDLPGAATIDKLNTALDKLDIGNGGIEGTGEQAVGDGWVEESVRIEIPTGVKQSANSTTSASHPYDIPGLLRRPLVEVIKAACQDNLARDFHFEPFKSFQVCPPVDADSTEPGTFQRLHDELYSSDAWITEQDKLERLPPEHGCTLPRAIAGLMFWSDATHVSQFGQSKMWPIYLFFGNLSKWLRCKPRSRACHHVAHIPSLPDNIQDFIRAYSGGRSGSAETLRHCKRELFQAVWRRLVMDPDFLHAYQHGIVIECADGITRRVYPRIFTYSADYPEKALVATIRDLGQCPCPLCLVTLDQVHLLGQVADDRIRVVKARLDSEERISNVKSARKIIYEHGYAANNDRSEYFLKAESLVATENAFSEALFANFEFNFFRMLVVDLMHEFELGVWKAVLVHLIRMLHTLGKDSVNEFNQRFRHIGNFGRSTIRSFAYMNTSDLKNWAARTYEDCLQCCIPCFEGLFPEPHNQHILRLLYTLALWHGLAKLRQHTDETLDRLAATTRLLGKELRFFANHVCPKFDTVETPKERAARERRSRAAMEKSSTSKGKQKVFTGSLPKSFSLRTVKLHLLGHYVAVIRWFGTTDSYSSQIGELQHRVVKSYYRRGNKKKGYVHLATRMQRRGELLHRITERVQRLGLKAGHKMHTINRSEYTPLPEFSPEQHYQMAKSVKYKIHIGDMVNTHPEEPALKGFIPALKDHILGRLGNRPFDGEEGEFTDEERDRIIIFNNTLYRHSTLRVNYTTYNMHRDQDIINPQTASRSFVMVEAADGKTRIWYARVLGIFHLQVINTTDSHHLPQRLDVLWIRWLGEDPGYVGNPGVRRLERVGYVPEGPFAFGFIDPDVVVRAAHLIPAFIYEKTDKLLTRSLFWDCQDGDWENYYVNPFVDRDMLSRFLGTGVGHTHRHFTHPTLLSAETIEDVEVMGYGDSMEVDNSDGHTDGGAEMDRALSEDIGSGSESEMGSEADSEGLQELELTEDVAVDGPDDLDIGDEDWIGDFDYGH